jgi:glutamate-5-semialdehyde dehydrogenase
MAEPAVPPLDALARRAKAASRTLATTGTAAKRAALHRAAEVLRQRSGQVLEANQADQDGAATAGLSPGALDRLRLTYDRVAAMADTIDAVAELADPVGEVVEGRVLPNGLSLRRVRAPLGVVAVIYENRPNVTADAAALCLASGNAVLLRGSSTALASNRAIAGALRDGIEKEGLPADGVVLVEDTRHETVRELVRLAGLVDCVVPRGGRDLVRAVSEHATVPVVIDGDGNCHVYVDAAADLEMAARIVENAKLQRPSVCNAMESLLVHRAVAGEFLPRLPELLPEVELRGDPAARRLLPAAVPASEEDFSTEFLDLVLSVAVVGSLGEAIDHIARHGSGHSEAIVTNDLAAASRFTREVDAAAVLVNASTRFVDGGQLGLGAEIGISTQKLHARGPMGLRELTTAKYVIEGQGQVRL